MPEVSYQREGLLSMLLSKALNVCIWQALSAEDRVGLLSDCYALCKAKMLDLGDLMELMAEFAEEESYTVRSFCHVLHHFS